MAKSLTSSLLVDLDIPVEVIVLLEQMERRLDAQQLVISWLLAQAHLTERPFENSVQGFLDAQIKEFSGADKFQESVDVLSELREDFGHWLLLRTS